MSAVVVTAILVTLSATSWSTPAASPESELLDSLFSTHNPLVLPVLTHNDTVDVDVGFAYTAIVGLDETEQSMMCHGTMKIEWTDPFLSWNDTVFSDIEAIYLPAEKMWTPDLVVRNSVGSSLDPIHTSGAKIRVDQNGRAVWMPSGMFKFVCYVDITFFPFDNQSCDLVISTNAYDPKYVRLHIKTDARYLFRGIDDVIKDNSQWEVLGETSFALETENGSLDVLKFTVHIKRRAHYFVLNVLFPSFVLAILNIFVLLIPQQLSDKLAVCTTLVLAYVIFLIQITDSTPVNSDKVPFITVILLVMMSISSLDVMIGVILLRARSTAGDKPPPYWLHCIMGKRKLVPEFDDKSDPANGVDKTRSPASRTGAEHNDRLSEQIKEDQREVWRKQWHALLGRLEWIIVVCQIVVVLVMHTSIPSVYVSQLYV